MTLRSYKPLTFSSCQMKYRLNSAKQISMANLGYYQKSLVRPTKKN